MNLNGEWIENNNGNHVLIEGGSVAATVFCNQYGAWGIFVSDDGLVANEAFLDPDEAMHRAEAILNGATCEFAPRVEATTTDWVKQKTVTNGSPTYGRRYRSVSASVKRAKSGKWFFVLYGKGPIVPFPRQWFSSAEAAMRACDLHHQSFSGG